ncbi:glycosyltransferase family 2 protein [Treponema brennaborense]|uniref:Glycosyl transferase family 2 n=1 Tax=Treponema brennaborense (strain DSM 12168 / CIP 105900 / DD5/3) TaxID=906968 RepID=F4LP48_TREBD|nr:glycosyltransferase family 2 protein [Treponema brennaborense]AEE15924.1 hypothetical protein Trebr_0480 [Treponema brennaborense DSM 12168]
MFSIETVKLITFIFFILYLPRMWCWFAALRKQPRLHNDKKNKLALVIPARNEGTAIIPLLKSIQKQSYAPEHFDVYIVVKEPDDPVHEYAKMINASVYVDSAQTSKGDCLDYCFKRILAEKPNVYDGYIIVDADCILAPTFMEEMNNAMASGADVINAKKLVKNYFTDNQENVNWVTSCNGLIWTFMDDMGNRWKSDHGFTTMTVTTGILFSKRLVEKWQGWIYRETLTEDMELQRDCAVRDYQTFYYSHAKFFMEESPSLSTTNKRRTRWMTGLTNADFIYGADMLMKKGGFHEWLNKYFMLCLWLVYLFIGSMVVMCAANAGAAGLAMLAHSPDAAQFLHTALAALGAIYAAFFVLTLSALIVDRKNIKLSPFGKLIVLLVHPVFYMGYIKIVARAIFIRKPQEWEVIDRVKSRS